MSEGLITYRENGELCGITTVINSELRNHMVCQDGLMCTQTSDSDGSLTGKKCRAVLLLEGDECNYSYDSCFNSVPCIKNINDVYTCGGVLKWEGNEPYIDSNYVQGSAFKLNYISIAIGVILLVVYLLLLVYGFLIYKKNSEPMKESPNVGCVRKLLRLLQSK